VLWLQLVLAPVLMLLPGAAVDAACHGWLAGTTNLEVTRQDQAWDLPDLADGAVLQACDVCMQAAAGMGCKDTQSAGASLSAQLQLGQTAHGTDQAGG
jgi:hypothetical protein